MTEMKTDLETIVDQANRCKRIISGLLNFARQNRVVRQPTDVSELVDKVIRTAPTADNIVVNVQDRLSDKIAEIDADQIVQVLTNLFTNAQHAMPEGGDDHHRPHGRSRRRSPSGCPTRARASPRSTWPSSSTRSSPPSRWAWAPAWAWR